MVLEVAPPKITTPLPVLAKPTLALSAIRPIVLSYRAVEGGAGALDLDAVPILAGDDVAVDRRGLRTIVDHHTDHLRMSGRGDVARLVGADVIDCLPCCRWCPCRRWRCPGTDCPRSCC